MKKPIKCFGQSLLGGIGVLWLFLEIQTALCPKAPVELCFWLFLSIGAAIGIIYFLIDGLWLTGFLKRSIEITSNAIDSSITVMFGDLFAQKGYKAISVNEFFDSAVDNKHVSANTLHGIMLKQYWAGNTADWDRQIKEDLSSISPIETVASRPSPGKHDRYPLGTTASVSTKEHNFLCVALANTNTENLQASAGSENLHVALRGLLQKARSSCSGSALNIPLIGSGLARTGIKPNIIVDLILLAVFEESKREKVTNEIRIILPKQMRKKIDLSTIQKDWR
ncbi:MAG: hypothetical protein JXB29_07610 [Sedimentisphaerales bacterium]|nr:hypothetical protein [Sedimentisphaerales bacterium]